MSPNRRVNKSAGKRASKAAPRAARQPAPAVEPVNAYRYPEADSAARPEIGTQARFRKQKPPQRYRFDSSLSPALNWDGQNGAREQAEWLLQCAQDAARLSPPQAYPQVARVAERYLREKVRPIGPANVLDVFLAPYYGWVIDRLADAIRPDVAAGEAPELPRYEQNRGPGSTADVDLWTTRDAREVVKCHLNYMVPDTHRWEQTAAYYLDTHPRVEAWVKNAGLGLAIPYLNDGAMHDYIPDFVIRLAGLKDRYLILETKGYDPLVDVKTQAAQRWVSAVNAEGSFGQWAYVVAKRPEQTRELIDQAALAFASLARPTIA